MRDWHAAYTPAPSNRPPTGYSLRISFRPAVAVGCNVTGIAQMSVTAERTEELDG